MDPKAFNAAVQKSKARSHKDERAKRIQSAFDRIDRMNTAKSAVLKAALKKKRLSSIDGFFVLR